MGDIVKFGGTGVPANPEDLVAGLANVRQQMAPTMGGDMLLRLLTDGTFAYGPENIEPEEGSLWAINPYSIQHGWACWRDGELLGEVMVGSSEPLPPRDALPDYGADAPWKQQMQLQLQCRSGEDTGVNVRYKSTAVGFANACRELMDQIIAQARSGSRRVVPLITLESDSYQHKKHGKTYVPVLTIQQWIDIDGNAEEAPEEPEIEDNSEGQPEPAPERPRRQRPQEAAEREEPASPTENEPTVAGQRRRRRRSQ